MKLTLLIILSVFFTVVYAQEAPILTDNSLAGIENITTRNFDQNGLWGYINGGADLYLEYGFKQLAVQDIRLEGSEFKADIYRMVSAEAAFGIFSVSRFRCMAAGLHYYHDCLTPYQYIAAKGNYYISVSNTSGEPLDQEKTLKIGKAFLNKIDHVVLQRPGIFENKILNESRDGLKMVHGPLGLQNGFIHWDRLFTGFDNYEAWILPVASPENKFTMAWIRFDDENQLQRFVEKNALVLAEVSGFTGSDEKFTTFRTEDGALLLFEGPLTKATLDQLTDTLN
ncbi:MAG: hypothetical protein IH597_10630 [Bacteroidales bacterium]|nr:hypothetical protein [Bacteroidales bacterium]